MSAQSEEQRNEELRDAWMESLLVSLGTHEQDQERVDRAIAKIDEEATRARPAAMTRPFRYASSLVAAAVLIVFGWWVQTNDPRAYALAAVERSLGVAAEPVAREYDLQVNIRTSAGSSAIDCNLYVKGANQFALRHPTLLPEANVWLGRSGDDAWVVPPFGPVLKGSEVFLTNWVENNEEVQTPYLHITTLLKRMKSRGYVLEQSEAEVLRMENGIVFNCDRISAVLDADLNASAISQLKPNRIDVWINQENGMTVQLKVMWDLEEGEWGRESVQLAFVGEPELPSDWFIAEGHFDGYRPIIDQSP